MAASSSKFYPRVAHKRFASLIPQINHLSTSLSKALPKKPLAFAVHRTNITTMSPQNRFKRKTVVLHQGWCPWNSHHPSHFQEKHHLAFRRFHPSCESLLRLFWLGRLPTDSREPREAREAALSLLICRKQRTLPWPVGTARPVVPGLLSLRSLGNLDGTWSRPRESSYLRKWVLPDATQAPRGPSLRVEGLHTPLLLFRHDSLAPRTHVRKVQETSS